MPAYVKLVYPGTSGSQSSLQGESILWISQCTCYPTFIRHVFRPYLLRVDGEASLYYEHLVDGLSTAQRIIRKFSTSQLRQEADKLLTDFEAVYIDGAPDPEHHDCSQTPIIIQEFVANWPAYRYNLRRRD